MRVERLLPGTIKKSVRRLDPEAEITIIEKNDLFSYAGCGIPYYLSGQVSDFRELMSTPAGVVRDVQFFKNVKNVKVEARTFAEEIDREQKVVKAVKLETGERPSSLRSILRAKALRSIPRQGFFPSRGTAPGRYRR